MAKTAINAKVGSIVYRPFEIMKPGKVTSTAMMQHPVLGPELYLEVKWLDGSCSNERAGKLNDFDHATEEHLKKYQKFDALRKKL